MNRSDCPISNALDYVGDRWSLLVIRDIAFFGKRSYNSLLESAEGIATNILSSRLNTLEENKIIIKQRDPADGRRHLYSLTESGKDLLPILIEMILWSARHHPENLDIPVDIVKMAKQDRDALLSRLGDQIDYDQV